MKYKIGILGGGNMGSAIISGIYKNHSVLVCETDSERAQDLEKKYKVKSVDLKTLMKSSQIIVLAVKPQNFTEILMQMKPDTTQKHLIISIAAGITTSYIEKELISGVRVVRAMPNLPAQIQMGMTGIAKGKHSDEKDLKVAKSIFDSIGKSIIVDEDLIDSITAVSGSGPAYVFLFVECYMNAAASLGLDHSAINVLVHQTLKGSLAQLEAIGESPGILRSRVTSKGGTTEAALKVFMQKYKMERMFADALLAAKNKAKELSK